MSYLLDDLNAQQWDAVQSTEGPVLVLAGPGSGKTRVLTRRITYLIEEKKIEPWHVLAVTFTNKAAKEMGDRVEELIGHNFPQPEHGRRRSLGGLTIGTFHAVCARVLRVEVEAAGFERNWVIYDTADQLALVREILKEMNLNEKQFSPRAVLSQIGNWKNDLLEPEHVRAEGYMQEICDRVYGRYQQLLLLNNAMDFDDLLMRTVLLLRKYEEIRRKYQDKWRYVLVDEFQDTNTANTNWHHSSLALLQAGVTSLSSATKTSPSIAFAAPTTAMSYAFAATTPPRKLSSWSRTIAAHKPFSMLQMPLSPRIRIVPPSVCALTRAQDPKLRFTKLTTRLKRPTTFWMKLPA